MAPVRRVLDVEPKDGNNTVRLLVNRKIYEALTIQLGQSSCRQYFEIYPEYEEETRVVSVQRVLSAEMREGNDADATTVGDYLIKLLATAWKEREDFSGKRPFGNSGWQGDIYWALVNAKLVQGRLDADGDLDEVDSEAADRLIDMVIQLLGEDW